MSPPPPNPHILRPPPDETREAGTSRVVLTSSGHAVSGTAGMSASAQHYVAEHSTEGHSKAKHCVPEHCFVCVDIGMIAQARRFISAATPSTPPHPPMYPEANGDIPSSTTLSMQMRPTPSPGTSLLLFTSQSLLGCYHSYLQLTCNSA